MGDVVLPQKPSPGDSGQADSKVDRKEMPGKLQHPKELLQSPFLTKASAVTRLSGLGPELAPSLPQVLLVTIILKITNGRAHSHTPSNVAAFTQPWTAGKGSPTG